MQGMVVPRHGGNYSMEDYVRGAVDDSNEDFSALAIRAKAAALYDRAIYVSSQYRVGASCRFKGGSSLWLKCCSSPPRTHNRYAEQERLPELFQLARQHD